MVTEANLPWALVWCCGVVCAPSLQRKFHPSAVPQFLLETGPPPRSLWGLPAHGPESTPAQRASSGAERTTNYIKVWQVGPSVHLSSDKKQARPFSAAVQSIFYLQSLQLRLLAVSESLHHFVFPLQVGELLLKKVLITQDFLQLILDSCQHLQLPLILPKNPRR